MGDTLKRIRERHLQQLADFLVMKVPEEKFSMYAFRFDLEGRGRYAKIEKKHYLEQNPCGTSGCALGWAPFVPGLAIEPDEYSEHHRDVRWMAYRERVFPGLSDREWSWLFSGSWDEFDDTPGGAALRIQYLLKNGLPETWLIDDDDEDDERTPSIEDVELYNEHKPNKEN